MRAIWKGHIQFSLVNIPVRIYNAIDTGQTISFNLLSKEGHNPVSYEKKDKVTGQPLKPEDIVKGYQYEPGQFVIVEEDDLALWNGASLAQAQATLPRSHGSRNLARNVNFGLHSLLKLLYGVYKKIISQKRSPGCRSTGRCLR